MAMKQENAAGSSSSATDAARTDELRELIRSYVSSELSRQNSGASSSATRSFGNVPFPTDIERSVNAFLHQKLGKDHLARRPGPRGTRLTYIESCKAIELANRAFGFNGWSCRILECKEEYRELKNGDRWALGFSALVQITLKDGTSHEDVGFGQSDGQKDLGAAIEQAKKVGIRIERFKWVGLNH